MSYGDLQSANPYASFGGSVAEAPADARADFIRKTYTHLSIAVYACAAICWALFQTGLVEQFAPVLVSNGFYWLGVLAAFMAVSWIAHSWAESESSVSKQYLGLGLYVVAEALLLCPLLWVAQFYTMRLTEGVEVNVIPAAGVVTLVMFGALTAIAWISRADFSFLRAGLMLAGFGAMALIACSIFFSFELGAIFSTAMIVFASAYILYDTSNIIHKYQPGQHVAASLSLFASVALLFWYVLRLFISLSED